MDKIDLLLRQAKKVLVTSHLQPDPDAICSALGMYDFILKEYKHLQVDCCLNGEKLEAYKMLKNYDDVIWVEDLIDVINNYDTIVFTDGSHITRFTEHSEKIDLSKFQTICIDHHNNEPSNFDAIILEPHEPSASQQIYRYFYRNDRQLLDPYVAEILLTGILSDTGMLKFVPEDCLSTFDYVKELIEASDLDLKTIEDKYFCLTQSDWDIVSELVKNIVKVDDAKKPFLYSYLPKEYLNKYSLNVIKQGRSKFQMLFATALSNYRWSFVATPNSNAVVNLSFRSSPGVVNVGDLAEQFGGGGHDLTSASEISVDPTQSIDKSCKKVVEKIKLLTI